MDGTHPVVYVSTGSHASHYTSALFLGRSGAQGFGCDTTLGPNRTVRPDVVTIPSDAATARKQFPWIAYEGHWGERGTQEFYDGPTGPNTKAEWTEQFSWSEQGRTRSYAVPGGQAYGGAGTAFFCSAVAGGSEALRVTVLAVLVSLLLGSLVGGLLGTLVILLVQAPFAVVNMVPGLAAFVLQPFISLMLPYAYFNGRAQEGPSPQPLDPSRTAVQPATR